MTPASSSPAARRAFVAAAVAVLTFAVFIPSLRGQFVNYDDDANFLDNPFYRGLGPEQLKWMFTDLHLGLWMPVTWITLGLDYVLWGMAPFGYHLTNVLFHAANALLCFLMIERLLRIARPGDGDRFRWSAAAAGALFFSLHPLRVESVSWVTERRDVVSGFFILLTVLSYLTMTARPPGSRGRRIAYGITMGIFVLAMLSKPTGMMLPLVLILLDVYPLKRTTTENWRSILLEKLPFLALMVGAAVLTSISLRHARAFHSGDTYPLVQRLVQPGYRVAFYVVKTLLPVSLSPLYIYRPELGWAHLFGWLAMAAVTLAVLLRRREVPAVSVAWVSFGVLIAPVSGVFQAGMHFAADRYTYLPCLPFAVLLASAIVSAPPRIPRPVVFGLASGLLLVLAALTTAQQHVWKDSQTLWTHALHLDPENYTAYNNRGAARAELGDSAGAMADYDKSIAIRPDWEKSWNNRAIEFARRGDHGAAVEAFSRSLQIEPEQTNAYGYRAISRMKTGDFSGAKTDLDEALKRQPEAQYYVRRALLRGMGGDVDGVIADCSQALILRPLYSEAWMHRGMAYLQKGDPTAARQDLVMALRAAEPGSALAAQIEKMLRSIPAGPR